MLIKLGTLKFTISILLAASLSACGIFKTALFDQYTYQQTIALKVESISLMKKATVSYERHAAETESLLKEIEKMMEYERYKENNHITYKMWSLIQNEDKNLFGGFIKRWKTQGMLSKPFIEEAAIQVGQAYDLLIRYESKKDKKSKGELEKFLK
jgi:hypothetical protein